MTISDPRAEIAGMATVDRLAIPNIDQIDSSKIQAYVDEVTKELPDGFTDQIWYGSVHDVVNHHVFQCFWADVDPKECADKIFEKIGAHNA